MHVELEILQGRLKQDDRLTSMNRFPIHLSRFLIGSDPSCHMVCKSRTIASRHCLIELESERVLVRDLKSRAGTFINNIPVRGIQTLRHGDTLRVGRLEFRVCIAAALPSHPAPLGELPTPAESSPEPNSETVVGSDTVDALITNVLAEEDEAARAARYADPGTRYFRTDQISTTEPEQREPPRSASRRERPKSTGVGKLPTPPPIQADDTVSAAEQALREIFHPTKDARKR